MDTGLVVGLSVGLAVFVFIFLVFGCKFARRNTEDLNDFSKEQLLGQGAVYRHKNSKTVSQDIWQSGEKGKKKKKLDFRQETGTKKSLSFLNNHNSGKTADKDQTGTVYPEPRRRLFNEYTESNDNNGIFLMDEWSRDCELQCKGNYHERGCDRKKYDTSSEKTRNANTPNQRYERRQKHPNTRSKSNDREILHTNRAEVHIAKLQGELKEQRPVSRNATVKQMVEEVKRKSKHNLQNGMHIKVGYNSYSENDFQRNHGNGSETKENRNSSSAKKDAPTHSEKGSIQSRTSERILSRPIARQPSTSPQEQIELSADRTIYRNYESRNRGQEVDRSRQEEEAYIHWSKENTSIHPVPGKPNAGIKTQTHKNVAGSLSLLPARPDVPVSNIHNQTHFKPREQNAMTSTIPTNRNIGAEPMAFSYSYGSKEPDSNGPGQYNGETMTARSQPENTGSNEALKTCVHHSDSGEKIPRPSTTAPYMVYSRRPSSAINAQRASSRAEPHSTQLIQREPCASMAVTLTGTCQTEKPINHPVPLPPPLPPKSSPPSATSTLRNNMSRATVTVPDKQLKSFSISQPGALQPQHSLPANTQSPVVSQPLYYKRLSPTRELQSRELKTQPYKQASPTARTSQQLSPSNNRQSMPPQLLPNIEKNPKYMHPRVSQLSPNNNRHASPTVNLQSLEPQPPHEKQPSPTLNLHPRAPKQSPVIEKPPVNGLQSRSIETSTHLRASAPQRSGKQPFQQAPSQMQIIHSETSKSQNQSPLKSSEIVPEHFTMNASKTTRDTATLDPTIQKQAGIRSNELVEKAVQMTDIGNLVNEKNTILVDCFNDNIRTGPEKSEDPVDFNISESDFNPGQTSTPQQSTTEFPDDKTIRTNRSMLHSALKKRRCRLVSSTQNMSNVIADESDSLWDDSISSNQNSVSVDGRPSNLQIEEKPAVALPNKSVRRTPKKYKCKELSDLTEKIATARDIRKDPDINAVLADIRARRKSSSRFN